MNSSNFPFVSIITNSYNSKIFLRRNIQSILAQSYINWEHIIVDCGSSDGSYEEAISLHHDRLKVYQIPFCNISDGRNFGINNSSGEIIAILDSDDIASPDRLTSQVQALLSDRDLIGIGSGMLRVDEGDPSISKKFIYPGEPYQIQFLLRVGFNPIPNSTFTFWKSVFYSAGGYSKLIDKCEDYELMLRMVRIGALSLLPKIQMTYSRRESSHTYSFKPDLFWFYIFFAMLLNSTVSPLNPDSTLVLKNNLLKLNKNQIRSYLTGLALRNFVINFFYLEILTIQITLKMIINNLPAVCQYPHYFLESLAKGINQITLKFSRGGF